MPESHQSTLSSRQFQGHKHVCAIFNTTQECCDVIGPFLSEGFRRGHMTLAMVNPEEVESTSCMLRDCNMDVDRAVREGKLALATWSETYLRDGAFAADSMISFIDDSMTKARDEGNSCVWGVGDMNWAASDPMASRQLIRYEVMLNELKPRFADDIWVCFYDANLFSGRIIADVIRAHPVVLLGKTIFENPYYTSPNDFLEELALWDQTQLGHKRDPVAPNANRSV